MIGTILGNYRVERELGEGGMSHVYVGRTIASSDILPKSYQVVLKVMSDELAQEATAQKRFIKEAQILSRLRHRYITRFYEFIPRESGSVLVMEFVEGLPLDRILTDRGALPLTEAVSIAQCLLEALVYAHGKGIVHRDIKPANLIVQQSGQVKVTDFGIAKIKEGAGTGGTVLTKSGFLLGTPHYMSPEQIREPKDAGARSDVYSSAVVLYEMITGQLPFNTRSLPKLIDAVYKGEKPAPHTLRPEVDHDLEAIVLKAMSPNQNQRYETARAFFEALEEYTLRPRRPATFDGQEEAGRIVAPPPPVEPPKPAEPPHWHLVSAANESGERHEVKGELVVGRDRSCGIVIAHPAVSRRHAKITVSGFDFFLEDLSSANGTYVNNARVEKAHVKLGDVVRFGADPSCTFVVRDLR